MITASLVTVMSCFLLVSCATTQSLVDSTTVDSMTAAGSGAKATTAASTDASPVDSVTTSGSNTASQTQTTDSASSSATQSTASISTGSQQDQTSGNSLTTSTTDQGTTVTTNLAATTNNEATTSVNTSNMTTDSADNTTASTIDGSDTTSSGNDSTVDDLNQTTNVPFTCPEYNSTYDGDVLIVDIDTGKCEMVVTKENYAESLRGLGRLFGRKLKKSKGFHYPEVSFRAVNALETGMNDTDCSLPFKKFGPLVIVETVSGECQMIIGIGKPGNNKGRGRGKGRGRKNRKGSKWLPVLQFMEHVLLD